MKRNLLALLILGNVLFNIHTQSVTNDNFEFKLNIGNCGGGMNVFSSEHDFELSASLINFFIEHSKTHIGFEITPLKYMANYSINTQKWNHSLYFLNSNIYWNPFNIKNIILGPYASINYLKIKDWSGLNTNEYVFSSGLRFLLRTHISEWKYPFHVIGSEIGYRNISGRHSFYFTINLDISILAGIVVAGLAWEGSDIIEANEDYERQINGTGPFVPKEPKQPKLPFQKDKDIK